MSVIDFYDQLSPFYQLIYPDWEASIARQSTQLDSVICELWGDRVKTVLDVACGVGTQAIGLAQLGYQVTGSDISASAVARAKREAARRGLEIRFGRADLRCLSSSYADSFDLVIACDNAIPHLLSDQEIQESFRELYRRVASGGGCLVSVRDYDPDESKETKVVPYGVRTDGDRRFLIFQVWEYHGSIYDLSMYFI